MLKSSAKLLTVCGISSMMIASCSQSASQITGQQDWAMQIAQDTCLISEITEQYLETNSQADAKTNIASILSQDENAILRLRYFDRDKHLLEYVSTHANFAFTPSCISEINAVPLVDGQEYGSTEYYEIYSSGSADLCRRVPNETNIRGVQNRGEIRTCFNMDTAESTFEVVEE